MKYISTYLVRMTIKTFHRNIRFVMCSLFILELSHPIPYTHDLQGTMLINQTKRLRKSNWNFKAKCAKIEILLSPEKIDQGKLSTIAKIFWKHHFCGKLGWNFLVTLLKKHCKCRDSTLSQRKKIPRSFPGLELINPRLQISL